MEENNRIQTWSQLLKFTLILWHCSLFFSKAVQMIKLGVIRAKRFNVIWTWQSILTEPNCPGLVCKWFGRASLTLMGRMSRQNKHLVNADHYIYIFSWTFWALWLHVPLISPVWCIVIRSKESPLSHCEGNLYEETQSGRRYENEWSTYQARAILLESKISPICRRLIDWISNRLL